MKRIITYMAALTALVLTFSCARESMQETSASGEGISLQVMWSEIATRADGDDQALNNEYAVKSLDWYFYKDTTTASVFHFRETIAEGDAKALKYVRDFVPGQTYGGNEFPSRADLRGTNGETTVFIVANLPSDKVLASPTLATLKAVPVNETFLDGDSPRNPDVDALNFIMTGQAQVKGTTKKVENATAEVIEMSRLAAKITYSVKVLKSKTTETTVDGVATTETWTPMLGGQNVRMYPQGALKKALLGVVDGEHFLEAPAETDFLDFAQVVVSSDSPSKWDDSDDNYFVTKADLGPYYTYPNNWEEGGKDTFIKIIVPWQVIKKQGNNVIYSAQREVYYKVLLPDPKTVSNTWYQLDIALEPGTENEPEVTVNANYKVAKWMGGGEQGINGYLKDIKYLIADRSDQVGDDDEGYFVTYTRGISIPYSASNPVVFKVIEASYMDFSTETPSVKKFVTTDNQGKTTYTNPNPGTNRQKHLGTSTNGSNWTMVEDLSTIESWFKFDNGQSVGAPEGSLVMNHWLNGDLTSDFFDVSPYTFTVRIYLQRDMTVIEELKIVQYPQTYIEAQESTIRGRESSSQSARFWGYIFINGKRREDNSQNTGSGSPWTTIMYCGGTGNGAYSTNHNMYVLTTGVLSDPEMRLGDPREETSYNSPMLVGNKDNGQASGSDKTEDFISARPVGGGNNRSLSYYYPTDPDKSPHFIAPKLRISSAFGRRGSNNAGSNSNDDYRYNYASAWNRCAAYQEDGYPAGRWRLPTEAEIDYINRLSQRDFIPKLFYGTTPYWTATPGVAVRGDGPVPGILSASTRCVYDDWFWGSEPVEGAKSTFMWGDQQR